MVHTQCSAHVLFCKSPVWLRRTRDERIETKGRWGEGEHVERGAGKNRDSEGMENVKEVMGKEGPIETVAARKTRQVKVNR